MHTIHCSSDEAQTEIINTSDEIAAEAGGFIARNYISNKFTIILLNCQLCWRFFVAMLN